MVNATPSALLHSLIRNTLPSLAREIWSVCYTLFKLMIPVIVVVKILEELGAIPLISQLLEPMMAWVGLPETMGLVFTTTLLTNIYAGMLLFFQLAPEANLTVAQVTVLSGMLLIAHGLPVEVPIVQQSGVRMMVAFLIRFIGAFVYGALLFALYEAGDWLQGPVQLVWQPELANPTLMEWALQQLESFVMIFVVISALLTLLRFLRWIHIERLMIWLLQPVLRLLGISPQATSITIIGVTLGLAFGGGLLIKEARAGHIQPKDIFSAMLLLALCHSMIEDTLLVLLMGADISGVLWFRLVFALVIVALATRLLSRCSDEFWYKYLIYPINKTGSDSGSDSCATSSSTSKSSDQQQSAPQSEAPGV